MNSSTPRFIMNALASGNEDMWLAERKFVDFRSFYGQFISFFAVFDPERVKIWIYRRFWFICSTKYRKKTSFDSRTIFQYIFLRLRSLVKNKDLSLYIHEDFVYIHETSIIYLFNDFEESFSDDILCHNPITQCHPSLGNFFWWDILSNLKYLFSSWTKCYKTFWQNFIRTWRTE